MLHALSLLRLGLHSVWTIRAVQCDNGQEFDNSASCDFFLPHSVQMRISCPYTSHYGRVERMIRTTNNVMRPLLFQAYLPARYWAEGLATSTYLLNSSPPRRFVTSPPTLHSLSPFPPTITIACSGALAILISLPLSLTSLLLVPLVSSLDTLLITRGTGAFTLHPQSPRLPSLMSLTFPSLFPLSLPRPLSTTPSLRQTMWFPLLHPCFLHPHRAMRSPATPRAAPRGTVVSCCHARP
jgi:hypothetical protein